MTSAPSVSFRPDAEGSASCSGKADMEEDMCVALRGATRTEGSLKENGHR